MRNVNGAMLQGTYINFHFYQYLFINGSLLNYHFYYLIFPTQDRPDTYPYLLVTIGSGVSILMVESESKFERIGGTATGGGTFWGLGRLLTGATVCNFLLISIQTISQTCPIVFMRLANVYLY